MRGPTPVRSSKHPSQKRSTASPASGHSPALRNIQELPPEILAEALLKSMTDSEVFGLKRHRELASVCRTWRDVILSTPQFWNAVTDDPQAGDPFRIVPAKLRRFKDGFLTIKYIDKPTDPESSAWDLLQPTVLRWEEVTLTLGLGNHSKLRSTLEQGMPNLRRLTLLSEGFPQEVRLGPTPRLAELCLSRRASLDLISGTTLSTLRRLTIKSIRPDSPLLINILPTLTECSLLELLHISSIRSFPANRTHSVNFAELDVTLPLLRVLEIEDAEASFISLLLRHLRADGLEQLTVHCLILGGCTLAVLRAVSEPRDGCGLILPVLNCRYTSSEVCLSLGERWLYIKDKTGRLSLKLWLNGRKDVRNVADLLDPVYRHCAASARSITMAIHLHHVESLESLHLLCGAAPMVASIHCNDGEQYGKLSRCVLNGISQNVCRTCPPGSHRPWNTFSRLSELRISVPSESNPLPEYARGVHVAYLSRRRIVQSAASSPGSNSLNDIPDLKIYINDAFVPPDLGSLDQDS